MKKTFSSKKSAFSLIELSIVLIIIGLLIAGVTGGASLIKSSQLRSVMGEARGYAVAVNAFYSQFNGLPGDFPTAIGSTVGGDNDGTIEYYAAATLAGSESSNAWAALRTIGAVDSISLTPVIASTNPTFGATSAANAPSSKIQSAGWVFDYRTYTEGAVGTAANQNVVILTATITGTAGANATTPILGTNISVAAIPGSDALSIDSKIDDGKANAGKVRGINPAVGIAATGTCYAYSSSVNSDYLTTSTSKTCALSYQVDVNS
ncbi:MAG: prepilin-type N-terminal cleavage/methylation domain-containing protein [Pseudomonadota bacterium]